ncbi:MAG: winged helix-turn-helix transcriptional regulator, partial [Candidatus Dadabacteria bacterium]|nr:winged helix-turn-helix transcriptional regulator [Candidatus Dadabacteria bacterium]
MKTDEIQGLNESAAQKDEDVPHTLRILDEVAKGKPMTQRDLSAKLGIALGMTNNYLKRLAILGYIQIVEGKKKPFHYILTPLGIAKKSVLTYQHIKRSYQIYRDAREKLVQFFDDLEKGGGRSIVLYRASVVAE